MTFASVPVRGSHHSSREESGEAREQVLQHKTVLLEEAVAALAPKKGDVVVDATYGVGGHSRALKAAARVKVIAIDADPSVLRQGSGQAGAGVIIGNFGDLGGILKNQKIEKVDKVLFDLGWNLTQLGAGRGFSFMRDEPLNMSYGPQPRSGFTAAEILNEWSEKVLADVFFGYGEERYARRIAKAVVTRRKLQPFKTSMELVETLRDAVPAAYRRGRLHPATKTFQALRIAVNDELGVLEQGLKAAWEHLSCDGPSPRRSGLRPREGGRIAVITFHSIEDRLVKRTFAAWAKESGRLLYKKPLTPSAGEVKDNPSARSAKLRAIQKLCVS